MNMGHEYGSIGLRTSGKTMDEWKFNRRIKIKHSQDTMCFSLDGTIYLGPFTVES